MLRVWYLPFGALGPQLLMGLFFVCTAFKAPGIMTGKQWPLGIGQSPLTRFKLSLGSRMQNAQMLGLKMLRFHWWKNGRHQFH